VYSHRAPAFSLSNTRNVRGSCQGPGWRRSLDSGRLLRVLAVLCRAARRTSTFALLPAISTYTLALAVKASSGSPLRPRYRFIGSNPPRLPHSYAEHGGVVE